ncbi:hypothetical protein ID080_00980 [Vibrio cholerae]
MSELGLIEKINREILHPLGLAITRNVETGKSEAILVADDGKFEYAENFLSTIKPDVEVLEMIKKMELKEF